MAHFEEVCHRNCALMYVGGVLELIKIYFRGLKGQFVVKKANFRALIAKIGCYRPILASRTPNKAIGGTPIFWVQNDVDFILKYFSLRSQRFLRNVNIFFLARDISILVKG